MWFIQITLLTDKTEYEMRNQIKNLSNSPYTMFSMLVLVVCLLLTTLPMKNGEGWTGIAVAGSLTGGVVLFAWLVWSVYVLCTQKTVKEMQPKPRFFIEALTYTLTLCWVYAIQGSWVCLIPFACLFAWYLYTEFCTAFTRE